MSTPAFTIASMHRPVGTWMEGSDQVLASFTADIGPVRVLGLRLMLMPAGHTRVRLPKHGRTRPVAVTREAMEQLHAAVLAAYRAFDPEAAHAVPAGRVGASPDGENN